MKKKPKLKGSQVIFSLVFLVLGYIVAFSYHVTQSDSEKTAISGKQWNRDLELRDQLVELENKNFTLQKELHEKQERVRKIETELSQEAQIYFNLAEDTEKLRMYLGKMGVMGQGVEVILADGAYNPEEENINNYIVHEHHVFKVINELYISGASAIAVNGQRLSHNSYILCNGPVIEIDGYQHPAPFVITAIGNGDVLASALNLTGGVKDSLVNENIQFSLVQKAEIVMEPLLKAS
ncbi:uncharacterized protein YlxW (UPF0749 family) [Cytobacillus eiseniae]|uniref:Uncharacterized protein YlxW (UPF0749 family) n=1 Tax=Cytobacillus eiseniae TaxID=762947 RepID=A0ABS4RAW9_9BACI|nr:DUF881 domain-containing protein [Cytobacillus eiseniae]MBP2240039.1 uncharacterized protein YlxW (UPF0749 family) [Cytobacillus eiseniae]